MPSFIKQPAEQYPIGIDFTGKLPTGATPSSAVLSAIDLADGSSQSLVVLETTTGTISGLQVLGRVRSGTEGHTYKITFVVTLNTADILEEDVFMRVQAI